MKTGPAKAAQSSTAARVSTVRETAHRETEGLAGSALRLQRSAGNRAVSSLLAPAGDLPLLLQGVLSGPGRPLDGTVRGPMEAGFGRAFDGVRIHTDERAAASARALNAAAYMWGRHIVFGAGRFAPGTALGRTILAHELAHVIQSPSISGFQSLAIGSRRDPHEREAEAAAAAIGNGRAVPSLTGAPAGMLFRVTDEALAAKAEHPHLGSANVGDVKEAFYGGLLETVRGVQNYITNGLRGEREQLPESVQPAYDTAVSVLNEVLGLLGTVVITVVAEVVGLASGLVDVVKGLASLLFGIAKFFVRLIYDTIKADKDYHETVKYLMEIGAAARTILPGIKKLAIDWKDKFVDAPPDRQSIMIGELTGQILALIATFGTGAAKAGNLPKVMATVPVVQGNRVALAVVQIGVMPAAAGGLVAGGGAVMYGKLGGGDPEPPAAGGKGKGTGERKGFSSEEIQEHFVRETGQGATMGERAGAETQGVSARKLQAVYEKHHLLVRQLHKWFHDQLGFDIDKYTVKISGDEHRLVHNYYRWNDLWKDFMKQHPTASKAAIRAHMKTMMKNVGLEGLPIVPYK